MKYENLVGEFLQEKQSIGLSSESIYYYKRNLNLFIQFLGNNPIENSTFYNYQLWLSNNHNIKKISIQTYARATKVFLRWLVKNNYIDIDLKKIQLLKAERGVIFPLQNQEISLLLNCFGSDILGERNKLICMLMLDCGLRRGEIPKIKKTDIYYDSNSILIHGKGSKERIVTFGSTVIKQMHLYNAKNSENSTEYFFTTIKNTPITKNAIKIMFTKLQKITGLERIYPHLLRHTFATNYLLDGGNLETLRIIMGHNNISTTQKYLHIAEQIKILRQKHISHLDIMYDNREAKTIDTLDLILNEISNIQAKITD